MTMATTTLDGILVDVGTAFRLELIRSTRGFEQLLEGFDRVRAITYVARAQNVLDFFEKHGYSAVELVLGESFTDVRGSLDASVLARLAEYLEEGSLRLYAPRKTIHSKLYILEKAGAVRDGGSYDQRMGNIACWNTVMDEDVYMVRKWNEFISA